MWPTPWTWCPINMVSVWRGGTRRRSRCRASSSLPAARSRCSTPPVTCFPPLRRSARADLSFSEIGPRKGGHVQNTGFGTVLLVMLVATLASCGKSAATLAQECLGGGSSSCYAAGEMYLAGSGVARDSDKAVQLFERACEGRDSKGCAKATQMFERACETGGAMACTMLGAKYLDGFGVPPDSAKAATLFEAACNQNEPVGCSNLAML